MGVGGTALHEWAFHTRTARSIVLGQEGGDTGVDDDFVAAGFENVGAWILGRNMFAPSRGAWPNDGWKGWWGDEPPYHCPVFVLTHHARDPIEMAGGTTFYFVTDGIDSALSRAREAADDADVRIGGGVETVRAYVTAGLLDELHLVVSPVLLGGGEPLLAGLDLRSLGYQYSRHATSDYAMHVVLSRTAPTRGRS
jgi:dihydrofolate reductase